MFLNQDVGGSIGMGDRAKSGHAVFVRRMGEAEVNWIQAANPREMIRPLDSVIAEPEWPVTEEETIRSIYAQATSDEEFEYHG